MARRKARSTRSSAFGSSGRISHDSSAFYAGRLYDGHRIQKSEPGDEISLPADLHDRLFLNSSESMAELPDSSIHLLVTSPPYNAGKEYDADLTLDEYRGLLRRVFQEGLRVLATGGRACINVANLGRKPYLPLHAYVIEDMLDLGFLMRGEIIWNKAGGAGPSTAWGSWRSAANPVLRDVHEYVLIFSKGALSRPARGRRSTIARDEFLEWTRSVWTFPPVSARHVGHPAPFPEELPRRLIELYSFFGDIVLDPFCGAGTTCLAAKRAGRHFVGYEIDPSYLRLAKARLKKIDPPISA
jgi:site-specific DNA-methyltransferase (adenine-specific)